MAILLAAAVLCVTGCEGPSTAVISGSVSDDVSVSWEEKPGLTAASAKRISDTVKGLCTGDFGEEITELSLMEDDISPVLYFSEILQKYSYTLNEHDGILEAVMPAEGSHPDLILLFACYGGNSNLTGASDTAAGAAMLLEAAGTLYGISTDTEVRFVFLPGTRNELGAVREYLKDFDSKDLQRLLGAVLLGPLGQNGPEENRLCTEGSAENFLAQQINRVCNTSYMTSLSCETDTVPVCNVLNRNRIPTVIYEGSAYMAETGTALDVPSLLDYDSLAASTDMLSQMIFYLCDKGTPSMQARAHFTCEIADEAFTQPENPVLPFGEDPKTLEMATGLTGEKIFENADNAGNSLFGYRYPMHWFGGEEILPTDCYFSSDRLMDVRIPAYEAGMNFDDVKEKITAMYGESTSSSQGPYGEMYEWSVPEYRVGFTLSPLSENYEISVYLYDTLKAALPSDSLGADRIQKLFDMLIPYEARKNIVFSAYSDGYGGSKAYLEKLSGQESTADEGQTAILYELGIDVADALNKEGDFADVFDTAGLIISYYASYLAKEYPQMYYTGFYNRFGGDEEYFADNFRLFSLAREKPEDNIGPAAAPVRYFFEFDDLTDYREAVQNALK